MDDRLESLRRRMVRDAFFFRTRHRGVEFFDEFSSPPTETYPHARMGTPLLPEIIPLDMRRLISEFNPRPSIDAGLIPETRGRYRTPGEPQRDPDLSRVACPVCNRWHPTEHVASRWVFVLDPSVTTPPVNPDSDAYRDWARARHEMWIRYYTDTTVPKPPGDVGTLVCSQRCQHELLNHQRATRRLTVPRLTSEEHDILSDRLY